MAMGDFVVPPFIATGSPDPLYRCRRETALARAHLLENIDGCCVLHRRADSEMAGRHRCRPRSIQIIRTGIVAAKDTKRPDIQQFHVSRCSVYMRHHVTSFR